MGEVEYIIILEDEQIWYLIGNANIFGDDELFYTPLKDNKIPPREEFQQISGITDENSKSLKLKLKNIKIGCRLISYKKRNIRDVEGTVRQRETTTTSKPYAISKIFQRIN